MKQEKEEEKLEEEGGIEKEEEKYSRREWVDLGGGGRTKGEGVEGKWKEEEE